MNYTEMLFNRDERLVNLLKQADSKNLELIEEINNREDEIERLNKRNKEIYQGFMTTTQELCEATKELEKANGRIKMALDYIKNAEGNDINYIATLLLGYPVEIEEKRKQVLDILGDDKE